MKSLHTKLVLSAIGIALLATPALAQHRPHRLYNQAPQAAQVGVYPNPVTRSGSANSVESGAAFDLDRGY